MDTFSYVFYFHAAKVGIILDSANISPLKIQIDLKRRVFRPIACIVAQNPLLCIALLRGPFMTTCRSEAATQSKNRMMKKIWVVAAISAVLLMVMCSFSQSRRGNAKSRYQLVFSDEFDLKDGAQPNPKVWQRSVRGTSRWNRWISKSSDVVFIRDGNWSAVPSPIPMSAVIPPRCSLERSIRAVALLSSMAR